MKEKTQDPKKTRNSVRIPLLTMLSFMVALCFTLCAGITAEAARLSGDAAKGAAASGTYKISTESLGGTLTVISQGEVTDTAAESNDVLVYVEIKSGYILNSITVTGKSKTVYPTQLFENNCYSFVMPGENVTVTAKYTYDKSTAFSGSVFWVDTCPSVTDSPMGLVKWSNYQYGSTSSAYKLYLPGGTDLGFLPVYYGDGVPIIDGLALAQGQNYSFTEGKEYNINGKRVTILLSDSASIRLQTNSDLRETPYGSMIDKERTIQTNGQFMSVDETGQVVDKPQLLAQIKGRGNSSWEASCNYFGKYAYNIKLDKKTDVLNIGAVKAKSFCLLANNMDESMLRNAEVFRAAEMAGMDYVPHCKTVDVFNNGNYLGSYLITEKVDVGGSKLVNGETVEDYHNVTGASVSLSTSYYAYKGKSYQFRYANTGAVDEGVDITKKSYLLEFDLKERATAEHCWFVTPQGQYISVKAPDDLNREEMLFIINSWVDAESAVYDCRFDEIEQRLDLSSFADVYLIQEFTKNLDSCASSYYVYYDGTQENPKWQATPIWDYDWALGGYDTPYWHKKINANGDLNANNELSNYKGWFAKYKCIIVSDSEQLSTWCFQAQLCNIVNFWEGYVVRAWNDHIYSALYDVFNNGIEQDYDAHYKSFNMNEVRYGFCQRDLISSWGSVDTGRNPYEAITYLKSWANYRLSWMQASLLLPFSGVSLKADKTMIAKGESITLTATPFPSCTTDLSYSFTCFDDSDIYEICETTDRTVTTEPNKVGTFRYRVSAKGANTNRYDSDFITVTVLKKEAASPPTCTSDGNIEYYVDNSNNKYYVRKSGSFKEVDIKDIIVSSSGHSYTEETIQPDCTNQGYTLHTCSKCSDSYKDTYTNALGHTFSEEVIPPTTTAQGYTLHTCTVCTYSYMDNYTDKLAEPLVNTTSLSKESIRMGGSITVCGSATGGVSPYEYVFYYKKSTDTYYKTLKALDSETTAVFEPTSAGTYNFRTKVKDQAGKMTVKDLTLTVTSDLSNTSYLSESSAVLGGSVTIYGAASGGSGPYMYVFYYKKSSDTYYKTLKALDETTTAELTPAETGTYNLRTKVKDQTGIMVVKDLTVTVKSDLTNTTRVSSSMVDLGGSVRIIGSATGGTSPYSYVFYYKKSTETYYKTLKALDETDTADFIPEKTGTYNIRTKVKDKTGTMSVKDLTVRVFSELINNSELSSDSIILGESVTITGAASGGKSPYRYVFYYKLSDETYYKTLKALNETSSADFRPEKTGTYNIRTKVKDKTGMLVTKDLTVKVKSDLTNNTGVSSSTVHPGGSVTITGSASGGVGSYEYAFYYKNSTDTYYRTLKAFDATTVAEFKPAGAGTYSLRTKVRDAAGNIAVKDITIEVE